MGKTKKSSAGVHPRATTLSREAKRGYEAIKREAEAKVVRWEWATFTRYAYEPAYFEIEQVTPGKPLAGEPAKPRAGAVGYGFDGRDRVVVVRSHTAFPGRFYETFYRHEEQGIARFHYEYDPAKKWLNVGWFELGPHGVTAIHSAYERGNWFSSWYRYDRAGLLVRRERRGPNPPYGDVHDFHDVEHDATGAVVRVYWRQPNGSRTLAFERSSRASTLRANRKALIAGLGDATVAALRAAAIDDAVYALVIHHCEGDYQHRLPPHLGVGRLSERVRFAARHREGAPAYIWNPAEWKIPALDLPLPPDLLRLCEAVNQDIWQNEHFSDADKLLRDLARSLAARDLPITRTPDFVAVVVDLDGEDPVKEVAAQLGAPAARALRAAKLL